MKNYEEINRLVDDLKFWKQTGKALPTMAECKCDNHVDYDMLEALLLVNPSLANKFSARYDKKKRQIVYNVLIPEMENDVRRCNLRAIRIICFSLSAKQFKMFCRGLENPAIRDYMEASYSRYCEARKTTAA